MTLTMNEGGWVGLWTFLSAAGVLIPVLQHYLPRQLTDFFILAVKKLTAIIYPYAEITIPEYSVGSFSRSEAYVAVEAYLSSACAGDARRLRADFGQDSDRVLLTVDDFEEVTDKYTAAKLYWYSSMHLPRNTVISWGSDDERRSYRLSFHKRHRQLVVDRYLPHVVAEGKEFIVKNRQRRLFTNNPSESWKGSGGWYPRRSLWSHVKFEHPSTFDTLAMDPEKKAEIVADLVAFQDGKEYYKKIGKPWKRGYLLYGPPGTGKSTMIAAMANFLGYDIYDLELTAVENNTELRKLFIDTKGKSIIVVEDIDCSIDLTGKRKKKKKKEEDKKDEKEVLEEKLLLKKKKNEKESKVTLSGLLNFIDGLWSACGGERIVVFTTNHVEKLDEALIRRGRMDKHIEMSYCTFDAFKVLAKNYLNVDGEHEMFGEISELLREAKMTPADVAENLIPKSKMETAEVCFGRLITALKEAKEKAAAEEALKKSRETGEDDDGDEEEEE